MDHFRINPPPSLNAYYRHCQNKYLRNITPTQDSLPHSLLITHPRLSGSAIAFVDCYTTTARSKTRKRYMMDFALLLIVSNSLVAGCVYFIINRIWGSPYLRTKVTATPVSTPYAQQALRASYKANGIAPDASPTESLPLPHHSIPLPSPDKTTVQVTPSSP